MPTLVFFALDHLFTYMTFFLYLAQLFKWVWRPQVRIQLLITDGKDLTNISVIKLQVKNLYVHILTFNTLQFKINL